MSEQVAAYIREALLSVGIKCRSVDISDYAPTSFGNLVAVADTDIGKMSVIYDRGFFVEVDRLKNGAPATEKIVEALMSYKRASGL